MSVRVLVLDASPGMGGAVTSLNAFVDVAAPRGWDVRCMFVSPAAHAGFRSVHPDRHGVRSARFGPDEWSALSGVAWYARALRRAQRVLASLDGWRPEVVIANNAPGTNASAWCVAALLRVPVVAWVRSHPGKGRAAAWLLRRASAVFAVGDDVASASIMPRDRVVVSEGLSDRQWPRRRGRRAQRWMWAAALTPWKGLDLAIEAYTEAHARRTSSPSRCGAQALLPELDVCWLPLARGPVTPPCVAPALQRRVALLQAPDLDVVRHASQVFLHTSLRPEPFGRSILESMAAGLCPVVPDEGSGPTLVVHGVSGLLYAPRDAGSLADAMISLADDPSRASRLGREAARRARSFRASRAFRPILHHVETVARQRSGLDASERPPCALLNA